MTKITWKPGTMLSPLPPVLVSCGTISQPNVMTVAWTGIICSDPVLTYVSIRPSRFSHSIIQDSGEFVINLPTWKMVGAVDFCGVKSGRNIDKFKETGLTPLASSQISAPQIAECPVSIECKVKSVTSYGTHDMFLAEVVAVNVDDAYINDKGALDLEKAGVLAFAHGKYYTLGRNLGSFGFSVNKEMLKQKQKMAQIEVVETKSRPKPQTEPKAEQSAEKKPRAFHRTPFGVRKDSRAEKGGEPRQRGFRSDNRRPRREGEGDVVAQTLSRPNKRYDKTKKVKTEYRPKERGSFRPRKENKN